MIRLRGGMSARRLAAALCVVSAALLPLQDRTPGGASGAVSMWGLFLALPALTVGLWSYWKEGGGAMQPRTAAMVFAGIVLGLANLVAVHF